MFHYKISKYNPTLFENGSYTLDEWTEYSDVGKIFSNQKLTYEEYCSVELNYINFIKDITDSIKADKFFIKSLEVYENVSWSDKQVISGVQLEALVRDCLRNKCWCKIYNNSLCFCFGYDFYLHLCIETDEWFINNTVEKNSLFAVKNNKCPCKQ